MSGIDPFDDPFKPDPSLPTEVVPYDDPEMMRIVNEVNEEYPNAPVWERLRIAMLRYAGWNDDGSRK